MDHATLTDSTGRKTDFRHVILLMTTNAGGRELTANSLGFTGVDQSSTKAKSQSSIERFFSPEFRNRLDGWVVFDPLGTDSVLKIVDKLMLELREQLIDRSIAIELTDGARDWLAEHGYDPSFGARPMRRLIEKEIKRPLVDRILFGDLTEGGTVEVSEPEDPKAETGMRLELVEEVG